jgi:TRAP-type C4-dicarboxylate transport system permease small subunit
MKVINGGLWTGDEMFTKKPRYESKGGGYFYKSTKFLAVCSAFVTMVLMVYITADVFGRYFLNKPMPNSLSMSETLMVFLAFLGLAYVQANKKNIVLDFLSNRFGVVGRALVEVVSMFLAVVTIGLIIWASWSWAWESWVIKDSMQGTFLIPYYYSKTAMVVGLIFLFIQFIIDFAQSIDHLRKISKTNTGKEEN